MGACYAREADISGLEELVLKIDWRRLVGLANPNIAVLLKGFIQGQKVKELLWTIIGDIEFKDLKVPLAVVATDANTGREVIIKQGSVIEAVRASICIPAIFIRVKLKDRFLMDGGIVNPVPVNVVKDMGATFVIGCNVIQEPASRRIAPMFRNWLKKKFKFLNTEDFNRSDEKAFLEGDDKLLRAYAEEQLKCVLGKLSKGLDFVAKVKNNYFIGTAKFITDFVGTQYNQFYEAIRLIRETKTPENVFKVAVIDGIA